MENSVQIALIASISALLGALIPTLFNFCAERQRRRSEIDGNARVALQPIYEALLSNLQRMINLDGSALPSFQIDMIRLSILGDRNTVVTATQYWHILATRGHELKAHEHAAHQVAILNSMRRRLSLDPIRTFELHRYAPMNRAASQAKNIHEINPD